MKVKAVATSTAMLLMCGTAVFPQPRLGGFVEYDNIRYFEDSAEEKVNGRNQGILQLEVQHSAGRDTEMFGSVEFRNDHDDPSRNRVYLDEAYINIYKGAFDFRIGKQIYSWGRGDAFNPTDNLTSWDYSDFLDTEDERIGALSLKVNYYINNWTFEGVLMPSFTPSTLPEADSRWWPSFPITIPNPFFPQNGNEYLDANYAYLPPLLPDEGLTSTQYALKVSSHLKGWDWSVSWFDGFDDLPGIERTVTPDSSMESAEITLRAVYHRRRAIGADMATNFGKVGFRGEVAYYLTEDWEGTDPSVDDPYLQYTAGLDYTVRSVISDHDLYLLIEWVQELQIPDRKTVYSITDLNNVFRKSLIGKADLDLGEFAKIKSEVVWNIYSGGWWLKPGIEWSAADGLEIIAELDLLSGPVDSFFGSIAENDRLQFRLKYSH